jgi:hypothetical protein
MTETGGALEILTNYFNNGMEYFSLARMGSEYIKAMETL